MRALRLHTAPFAAALDRLRALNGPEMPVRTSGGMLVDTASVAMQCRCARTLFDFSASTDDMSALDYELRINGVINEVIPEGGDRNTITYHEFRGPFTVTVAAVDLAGNASSPSNAITVSTQGGGCF